MAPVRSRRRNQDRLRADLAAILVPEPRTSLPVLIWRWRYELALLAGVAAVLTALIWALGIEWGIIAASVLAGLCSPPWPWPIAARVWCVITAHRLRCGFVQARIQTRRGRIPIIRSATPARSGNASASGARPGYRPRQSWPPGTSFGRPAGRRTCG